MFSAYKTISQEMHPMNRKIFQIVFMLVNGIYTLDILSVAEGETETQIYQCFDFCVNTIYK